MSLSCECDYDGDAEWYYNTPDDYAPLSTKRSRKCCSCKERIAVGDLSLRFSRWKHPEYGSIAEKIYGEGSEIPIADWWMCERCGDLYLSLAELKFCVDPGDDMRELVREYAELYGPQERAAKKGQHG